MEDVSSNKLVAKVNRGVIYFIFGVISFLVIYPLVYVVSGSFAPGNSVASMSIVPFADGFTLKQSHQALIQSILSIFCLRQTIFTGL